MKKKNIWLLVLVLVGIGGCGGGSSSSVQTDEIPVAVNDKVVLTDEESILIDVLQNDYDPDGSIDIQTIQIVSMPKYGKLEVTNGKVRYSVENNYTGDDTFSYTVNDNKSNVSKPAVVLISILKEPIKRDVKIVDRIVNNWYMQFTVTNIDNGQKYSGFRLGEISTAENSEAQRKYSLRAFNGNGFPFVKMISIDSEGVLTGEYTTLYKPSIDNNNKYWKFKVVSSDVQAEMVLHWNGIYLLKSYVDKTGRERFNSIENISHSLVKQMKLIDLETGDEVAAINNSILQEYQFSMNGKNEHWFQWVLSNEDVQTVKKLNSHKVFYKASKKNNKYFDLKEPPIGKVQNE